MLNAKPENLLKLKTTPMPFGKHKGVPLIDLPETYVIWLHQNIEHKGEIGQLLAELYEVKVNGLESLIKSL